MKGRIAAYRLPISAVALFFLTLMSTSCTWLFYSRYQLFNDEFRNSTKAITRMDLRPIENRTEIGNAYIIFERDKSDRSDDYKMYCVVSRSSSSFSAGSQAFLKIDNSTYEINLTDIISEQRLRTETTAETYTKADSTTVSSGSTFDSDTRTWIEDKFSFVPTYEMIDSLKSADKMLLRFYFGPIPATYRIRGTDLRLLKKTLVSLSI